MGHLREKLKTQISLNFLNFTLYKEPPPPGKVLADGGET